MEIEFIGEVLPQISICPEVKADMDIIINLIEDHTEIGWLGLVKTEDMNIFSVYKILPIPEQDVNGGTTEITPDGLAKMMSDLLTTNELSVEDASNIRMWGHLHPHGSTTPSSQDDAQMLQLSENINNNNSFFIRCIANKSLEYSFSVFLYDKSIAFHKVPYAVQYASAENRKTYWKTLIDANVKQKTRVITPLHHPPGWDWGYDGYTCGDNFSNDGVCYPNRQLSKYNSPNDGVCYPNRQTSKYNSWDEFKGTKKFDVKTNRKWIGIHGK